MALKLGMNFIKYTLLFISFLYLLTASVLATIGGTVMERFSLKYFFEEDFVTIGRVLFFTGIILLFVSLLGVVAAGKESTLLVNIFGGFIITVIIIEVAAVIHVHKVKGAAVDRFDELYSSGMVFYNEDVDMHAAYNYLHSTFACCGLDYYTEWLDVPATESPVPKVPSSCCSVWIANENETEAEDLYSTPTTTMEFFEDLYSTPTTTMEFFEKLPSTPTCQQYFSSGCSRSMEVFLNKKSTTMGITAIILIQLIGLFLILTLGKAIRNAKTERELEKWRLKEKMATQMQHTQMQQIQDIHPKGILVPTNDESQA